VALVEGDLRSRDDRAFYPGDFLLLPRGAHQLTARAPSTVLQVTLPPR
jgi:hypothetical protein